MDDEKKYPTVNIYGIKAQVAPIEDIVERQMPIIAMPVNKTLRPWEDNYATGTKAGFPCSMCGQDCVLAPSGQEIYVHRKNPLICMDCYGSYITKEPS